jgi:hypothetical protein
LRNGDHSAESCGRQEADDEEGGKSGRVRSSLFLHSWFPQVALSVFC